MYYEVPVTLCFDTEQPINLDTIRAYLRHQTAAVSPCFIAYGTIREVTTPRPWTVEQAQMKAMVFMLDRSLGKL